MRFQKTCMFITHVNVFIKSVERLYGVFQAVGELWDVNRSFISGSEQFMHSIRQLWKQGLDSFHLDFKRKSEQPALAVRKELPQFCGVRFYRQLGWKWYQNMPNICSKCFMWIKLFHNKPVTSFVFASWFGRAMDFHSDYFFVLFSGVVFEHEEKKAAQITLLNVLLNKMHTDFTVLHFMSPAVKGKTGLFSFLSSLSRSSTEVLHS